MDPTRRVRLQFTSAATANPFADMCSLAGGLDPTAPFISAYRASCVVARAESVRLARHSSEHSSRARAARAMLFAAVDRNCGSSAAAADVSTIEGTLLT